MEISAERNSLEQKFYTWNIRSLCTVYVSNTVLVALLCAEWIQVTWTNFIALNNYQRRRSNGGGDIASLPSVCMSLCQHDKTKTPDRNDLKLGTVVVLGNLWKPVDFSFKRSMSRDHHLEISAPPSYLKMDEASTNFKCCSQLHYGQLLPVNQKLCRNAMGVNRVIEYNSP